MARSKQQTQAYAAQAKTGRESAQRMASHASPVVREAINRAIATDVLITADRPDVAVTSAMNDALLDASPAFRDSLPQWLFEVCPDWFIIAAPIIDPQTGRTLRYDTKRDVDTWDQARIKGFNAIGRMEFEIRERPDGTIERYIPEPCNMARLLSYVVAGNMQAVIESASEVLSNARVTTKRAAGFAFENAGAAQVVDAKAYAIILAAEALGKRYSAYRKASDKALVSFDKKDEDRATNARKALETARQEFDHAWALRHTLPADVLVLLNPPAVENSPSPDPAAPIVLTPEQITKIHAIYDAMSDAEKAQHAYLASLQDRDASRDAELCKRALALIAEQNA